MPPNSPDTDDLETRFWLRTVAAGAWATFWACAAGLAYDAFFAESSHRLPIAVVIAIVMAQAVAGLWLVPWERFVRTRSSCPNGRCNRGRRDTLSGW